MRKLLKSIHQHSHRLAILDLSLGAMDHHNQDGLRVAESIRRLDPGCTVLFLTGFATVELAVQVLKDLGAYTCLRKETFRRAEFRKIINEALTQMPPGVAQAETERNISQAAFPEAIADVQKQAVSPKAALVVEDDAGWRSLLDELLQDAGYQVRTSTSYVEAIGLLKREQYQVAVVDLALASSLTQENLDGYRLLTNMQKLNIPVVVVSGYADPQRIEQAYQEGLIVACLEKQAFDRKSFRQTILDTKGQSEDPMLQSLTDREREVLALLARGLTNKEIARELTITPNTVKRHLKSLFTKLEVNTRSAASAKAISMGLEEVR